jgi:MFS family permease
VTVLLPLLGGIGLLGLMVWIEAHSESPLIPLQFFENRTRVVTNFTTLFFSSAFFSYFFLLTLFEQHVLGYSPLKGGLGYLPFGLTIGAGIGIGTALMPKLGVKPIFAGGFVLSAVGMFLTSGISVHSSYVGGIMPGMIVLGLGSGLCFPAMGNAALHQVTGQDSSLASGVQSAMQQVGGALGLSVLVTLGLRHAAGQVRHGVSEAIAITHGYVLSFRVGSVLLLIGGVLILVLLEHVTVAPKEEEIEDALELETVTPIG